MKKAALLLIDIISDFDFPGGDRLRAALISNAPNIERLQASFRRWDTPVIYVNDNYGRWRDDFQTQMRRIAAASPAGKELVGKFKPDLHDYFILKPHRSAFFKTPLDHLLETLGVERLVLAGQTTDMCIAATAIDAKMREFEIFIPNDCCVAIKQSHHEEALRFLRRTCDAICISSTELTERFSV
jgi:nicotinamidase-related amidase